MSRRSTLGPLSLANFSQNAQAQPSAARKSLGAVSFNKNNQNAALPTGDRLSLSRSSLAGASSSRRSSASHKGAGRSDPRPIGDKNFLRENIKRLIMFLAAHNYQRQISPKLLMAPSGKDFRLIVEFLFQQFDPLFSFSPKIPFEEEVKKFMKFFGYPMPVSKQSLSAPGIPHTWPGLLAMLIWLIEFLQYQEKIASSGPTQNSISAAKFLDNDGLTSEKLFFDYTAAAYANFLGGSDNSEDLDSELRKAFTMRNQGIENETLHIKAEKKRLQMECEQLRRSSEDFHALKQSRSNLQCDIQKFQHVLEELKKHKEGVDKKIEERKMTQEEQKTQLRAALEEKDRLQEAVRRQEFTVLQVQSMNHQRGLLEESLHSLAKQKEKLQADLFQCNAQASKRTESIRHAVQEFNERVGSVEGGDVLQLTIAVNQAAEDAPAQILIEPSLNGEVSSFLSTLQVSLSDRLAGLQRDLRDVQSEASQALEGNQEKGERIAGLESRIKKLEETYKTEREFMHRELTQSVCRVEDEELACHKLRSQATSDLQHSQQKLQMLEQQVVLQSQQHDNEKREINANLLSAMEALLAHKERVQERLQQLRQQAENTKIQIQQL